MNLHNSSRKLQCPCPMSGPTLYSWGTMQGECKRPSKQKPPHAKGTTNKSHHTFRRTLHSQSGSPHLHSPPEQHAPLVPLSCPTTAKGTTNKSRRTQKAPQTKATTHSGVPFTVRVGVPICIHHLIICTSCAFVVPSHRKRHNKQKPPHAKGTKNKSHHTFRPVRAYPSQSECESPSAFSTRATYTSCAFVLPSDLLSCPATVCRAQPPQKAPQTKLTNHHKQT